MIEETIYPNYANLTNQIIEVGGNLSFSKPEANCVEVYFPSTTSVQFCEKREMLSFVVTLSEDYRNSTRGLLGTWNDDPTDDFTLPNGTVLSPSSTSREIHFDFGVKCELLLLLLLLLLLIFLLLLSFLSQSLLVFFLCIIIHSAPS